MIISLRGNGLSSGAKEQTTVHVPHCMHSFSEDPLSFFTSLLNAMSVWIFMALFLALFPALYWVLFLALFSLRYS